MKFRNLWIDPRVAQVRSASAQAYLESHGWKALTAEQANLQPFEFPSGKERPVVLVPLAEAGRDYTQRIIELITELALAEERYAVEVLNELLETPNEIKGANGPVAPAHVEPTLR